MVFLYHVQNLHIHAEKTHKDFGARTAWICEFCTRSRKTIQVLIGMLEYRCVVQLYPEGHLCTSSYLLYSTTRSSTRSDTRRDKSGYNRVLSIAYHVSRQRRTRGFVCGRATLHSWIGDVKPPSHLTIVWFYNFSRQLSLSDTTLLWCH